MWNEKYLAKLTFLCSISTSTISTMGSAWVQGLMGHTCVIHLLPLKWVPGDWPHIPKFILNKLDIGRQKNHSLEIASKQLCIHFTEFFPKFWSMDYLREKLSPHKGTITLHAQSAVQGWDPFKLLYRTFAFLEGSDHGMSDSLILHFILYLHCCLSAIVWIVH